MIVKFSVDPNAQPMFRWCALVALEDSQLPHAYGVDAGFAGTSFAVLAPTFSELTARLDSAEIQDALRGMCIR